MNRKELVEAIASDSGISKSQAQAALDSLISNITGALKGGDKVSLVGFGSFSVSDRAAREGRNPATGKPIKIPAKKVARFSAGKALKDEIN
jgi:DNA-binding protein HU-beta